MMNVRRKTRGFLRGAVLLTGCGSLLIGPAFGQATRLAAVGSPSSVLAYSAQVLKGSKSSRSPQISAQQWRRNRAFTQALSNSVAIGMKASAPGGFAGGSNSSIIAVLRRQSVAAHSLLVPSLGPSRTMSSQGNMQMGTATGNSATELAPTNGPTRHQSPGAQRPAQSFGSREPASTQFCVNGIGAVDGQKSGIWFSPVSGPEGTFVIQGCGFGTTPGEVYLSGVHSASGRSRLGAQSLSLYPGRVGFQIQPNGWSDRRIVASIDPNASGLYDTNNVTLVVKTASGQQYQATGFNFAAAYELQTLASIPKSSPSVSIQLAAVNDSSGEGVLAIFSSPWISVQPRTAGVDRAEISWTLPTTYTFPGGTDTYQFHFAPGFRLANNGVQLYHSNITAAYCQSVNGQLSSSGNWNLNYTSPTSFQVSWQEQSCWPNGKGGNPLDYGSVASYDLEITVWGPRGVSPW
jgi:hypothetical protein